MVYDNTNTNTNPRSQSQRVVVSDLPLSPCLAASACCVANGAFDTDTIKVAYHYHNHESALYALSIIAGFLESDGSVCMGSTQIAIISKVGIRALPISWAGPP